MKSALRSYLLAQSGISALIGTRIFWLYATQGVTKPYVIMQGISKTPHSVLGGAREFQESRVQIDIYGDTYAQVASIASQIQTALHGQKFTQSGVIFHGVFMDSERDLSADGISAEQVIRISQDYLVKFKE